MKTRDALCRYPLYSLLPPAGLDAWLAGGQEVSFATGETVFQANTPGAWAYLLLGGRARVLRKARSGREVSLGSFGPGELFGDYALLPPGLNTTTCRAMTAVRALRLPLGGLLPLVHALPGVWPRLKDWFRLHALLGYLREQTFLGFMSAESALRFVDSALDISFRLSRTIQAEGLNEDRWFFIVSGSVALHPAGDDSTGWRELGPGDFFGQEALISRPDLPVAVALTPVRCLFLARGDFLGVSTGMSNFDQQSGLPSLELPHRAFPWVGQREASDCGVAALTMVMRFHGAKVELADVRSRVPLQQRGSRLLDLAQAAASLGFRSQAVRIGQEQYAQVVLPAIVHLSEGHYVVLYAFGPEGVLLGDPETGLKRLSLPALFEASSGHLLLVHPGGRPQ